jgi:cytochrome P450
LKQGLAIEVRNTTFGYGRRICPGINLADLSLWISVAMTLAVFDLRSVADDPARYTYRSGLVW